jgi:hypothetical protein
MTNLRTGGVRMTKMLDINKKYKTKNGDIIRFEIQDSYINNLLVVAVICNDKYTGKVSIDTQTISSDLVAQTISEYYYSLLGDIETILSYVKCNNIDELVELYKNSILMRFEESND